MPEVWLRTNQRALALAMILPAALFIVGLVGIVVSWLLLEQVVWGIVPCVLLCLGSIWMLISLRLAQKQPRLAYQAGNLLVYLSGAEPVRVPIDIVECYFRGQGDSNLPKIAGREPETTNVVVRLAEAASDWHHRDTDPRIAHWCEGYITIRGAWCEQITDDGLRYLNKRLVEVHREQKAARQAQTAKSTA